MSPVQDFAGEILMMLDGYKAADDWQWSLKSSLVAAHPELLEQVFPPEDQKISGEEEATEDLAEEIYESGDLERVDWRSPTDGGIEEFERVMTEIAKNSVMTLGPDDVEADADGLKWY